jgi:hypothetical protein
MCMVPCTLVSKGPGKSSWKSLPGSDAPEQAQTGQRKDVLQGVFCRGTSLRRYWLQSLFELQESLSGNAASLGVERLWSHARAVLTDNRRSILMQRIMQLLSVKMNGMLLEGEALSHCAKSMSAMIDNEASFESIFDDLQQFEEEEQAGCAEQQGAGDLVSDAEGSVAPEADAEAAMPIVDLFAVRGWCTAAPQFTRVVWALLRAI